MAKRGRPSKTVPPEDHAKVAELLAKGSPICELSSLFKMTEPTFRKYFRVEILSEKNSRQPKTASPTVTDAMRERVKRYVGVGMRAQHIAYAMGYESEEAFDLFKAEFSAELKIGKASYRAVVVDKMHEQMTAGLVGATNRLESLTAAASVEEGEGSSSATQQAGYVGKKVAAKADAAAAVAAGGRFAPRSMPKLAAVNGTSVPDDDE